MISIQQLEKSFNKQKVLKGVDFNAKPGKIYAVLGPNGSGKTTLIKCILGLVIPDKGNILVNGHSIKGEWTYRHLIGYMPQIARFPDNLNMTELIRMIKDIRKSETDESELIHHFKLEEAGKKLLKHFSGGMKQKVNAILTLMFNPEILIFDEPSVGLDPVSHIKLKEKILEHKRLGKTIIITTHIMSEVDELADEIAFLLDGKVYFNGRTQQLKDEQQEEKLDRAIARMMEKYEEEQHV